MIIKRYKRAIVQRLGRYHRQSGAGVETRIPFINSVLVIDVREKVRELKAEKMLTKDNVSVTIDTILRYRIMSAPRATPKISVMQR
jgi:regulator of protease activity HflC (stomatin/prohibitin superfamily)